MSKKKIIILVICLIILGLFYYFLTEIKNDCGKRSSSIVKCLKNPFCRTEEKCGSACDTNNDSNMGCIDMVICQDICVPVWSLR